MDVSLSVSDYFANKKKKDKKKNFKREQILAKRQLAPSYTSGGTYTVKPLESTQRFIMELTLSQQLRFSGCGPRNERLQRFVHKCPLHHGKSGNNPGVHQWMNEYTEYSVCIQSDTV